MTDFELEFGRDLVRKRPQTLVEKLKAEFTDRDEPMTLQEIRDAIEPRWTAGSARNLMSKDSRFMAVDISTYALSEWGLREYRGIKEEIIALVEDEGELDIDYIIETLTSWFPAISPRSVRGYASTAPLKLSGGVVSLVESGEVESFTLDDMTPRQLRSFYRYEDGFGFRFDVTSDLLRGSGFPCSRAVGAVVGIPVGDRWSCPIDDSEGTLKLYNRPTQSALSSIRTTLLERAASEGDLVFLFFTGSEGDIRSVQIHLLRSGEISQDPQTMVLQLLGCEASGSDSLLTASHCMLGNGNATWEDIRRLASARSDAHLERAARLVQIQAAQTS